MYKLNCVKPSTIESSDLKFNQAKSKLSALSVTSSDNHIIVENYKTFNQLDLGSCVANATIGAIEILMAAKGTPVDLSRLFTYYQARAIDKENPSLADEGCFIKYAFESLKTLGVTLESNWAYKPEMVFTQPSIHAYSTANDNKISDFYAITSTGFDRLDDVETAIKANHPVVIGTAVSDEFTKYFNQPTKVWSYPEKSVGNHAMCIVGFRTNEDDSKNYLLRNSWGPWGDNGSNHTWVDDLYIMSSMTTELWVPTLIPNLIF